MPRSRQLAQDEYENLASFRFALRQFLHFSEQAALQAGITPQQHQALLAIKGNPGSAPMTVGNLADRMLTARHSTVGLVDRLVLGKLVRRETSREDRRKVFVNLTPKGETLLEKLAAAHKEELDRVGPEIQVLLARLSGHAVAG